MTPAGLQLPVTAWQSALAAHPRIGDVAALKKKYDAFNDHSQQEQAGASQAPLHTLQVPPASSLLLRHVKEVLARREHIASCCVSSPALEVLHNCFAGASRHESEIRSQIWSHLHHLRIWPSLPRGC